METASKKNLPQADLIANRMLFMIRDRWPTIYNSLTGECLQSMRAIVANDIDCLLKALSGDAAAQEVFALFEKEIESQKLVIDGRREYFEAKKERMRKIHE